ncbi:hypothetical protein BP6252_00636 [Coleophoma cylindrospora]|uniref:Methyltransferase domain-containing protein n=1 Tax=Coleophoma cylindrospora TaxID=1849047 RepID=A0A3D8SQW9_9HELO|nr:hypothetical protein BP6252_00636 [Coleophoma cylindrospora]
MKITTRLLALLSQVQQPLFQQQKQASRAIAATAATNMASKSFHDIHSNSYDRMSSRCTTTVAAQILGSLTPPITPDSYILDNACGTGIVTTLIKAQFPSAHILAADLAPGILEVAKAKIQQNGWQEGFETEVLDVRDLKTLRDGTFSHVITNFGFAPNVEDLAGPEKAAKEMWRVLKPGGVAVVTTWYQRNFDAAFLATSKTIRPDAEPFTWSQHPSWETGWYLVQKLEEAGFGNKVMLKSVTTAAEAPTLDELVDNMLLFKDMFFKGYSEEEQQRLPGVLKEELAKLEAFEETEEKAQVGMIAWVAYAWK